MRDDCIEVALGLPQIEILCQREPRLDFKKTWLYTGEGRQSESKPFDLPLHRIQSYIIADH